MVLAPTLYVLTFIRNLDKFAVFSLLSQVANVIAFTIIIWSCISEITAPTRAPSTSNVTNVTPKGLFVFYSIAIYSFEGSRNYERIKVSVCNSTHVSSKEPD